MQLSKVQSPGSGKRRAWNLPVASETAGRKQEHHHHAHHQHNSFEVADMSQLQSPRPTNTIQNHDSVVDPCTPASVIVAKSRVHVRCEQEFPPEAAQCMLVFLPVRRPRARAWRLRSIASGCSRISD